MKKFFIYLFLIVCATIFYYNYKVNTPVENVVVETVFKVESGEGVAQIGQNLAEAGLIKSEFFFKLYIWRNGLGAKLKAGEYNLSAEKSIKQIVETLTVGQNLGEEQTIKIIEGWDLREIGQYFEAEGICTSKEWLQSIKINYGDEYDFLNDKPNRSDLEGYLFPDTYRIFKGSTPDDIILKMLDNFDAKLSDDMKAEIKKQGKTVYEILTMASIVQKEVRSEEDMKIVAGIFWDRIKNGQPLQSCATLAYILGVDKKQYTIEDTKTDSPYNTYQHQGLPPGPIANPGLEAIKATIYPEYTDYNYFLSSTDGETIYSVTYDEHVRNKAIYLR